MFLLLWPLSAGFVECELIAFLAAISWTRNLLSTSFTVHFTLLCEVAKRQGVIVAEML